MAKKTPTYKELMSDKVMNSGKYNDDEIMRGLLKFKLVDPKDWMSKKKPTKKPTKKTAKYSPKSSSPNEKRINYPKPKVRLSTGGSPKKYGIVNNLKRK